MSHFFDDLERDLVRAAAVRARPARKPLVAFGIAAALVLGVAGTAAGGTYLALRQSSIAPFSASDVTPEQRVAPGTSRVLEPRAADPDGGATPPWALRLARSGTGLECTTVGQVRGEAFGLVGLDDEFRALPEANADACGEGVLLGTRTFSARRTRDVRTVVNGVGGEDLTRVTVAVAGGKPRAVPHSPEGGFVFVLRGYPEDSAPVVTLERASGTKRYEFAGSDGFTVPDPAGGRAWRITAMGFGTNIRPGEQPARLQVGCVTFGTARYVEGERNLQSPRVCGMQPGRPGVKLKPLYFQTRRVHGRVAVYGSAREHRSIVVRAGRFTQTVKPRLNGGFLVFLPDGADTTTVTVTVDGKRYGPSFGTVKPPRAPG